MNKWLKRAIVAILISSFSTPAAFAHTLPKTHEYEQRDMCRFLHISKQEFMKDWVQGKSFSEIAERKGVTEWELFRYFVSKQYCQWLSW